MEKQLYEAALRGEVKILQQLIRENPLILAEFSLISPHENPLHIATKAGQLVFVREMMRLVPELAKEENQQGFRPLDIASALGHVEIVKELIISSCNTTTSLCRLKGREGRTAIHFAVVSGKLEVMEELLSSCAESIKDITSLGETALHLAVKYHKFEALRKLVEWLEKLGLLDLANWADNDGNTVLHLAVIRKQHESVQLLLRNSNGIGSTLKLNATNSMNLTAMDLMDTVVIENPNDVKIKEMLQRAGALNAKAPKSASSTSTITPATNNNNNNDEVVVNVPKNDEDENTRRPVVEAGSSNEEDWVSYFRFNKNKESPSDARNTLLVVVALIATVTFQAGITPPEGMGEVNRAKAWFFIPNTLGFSTSISMIHYLTEGFPFQRELIICVYSVMFAYGWSVGANLKPELTYLILIWLAFFAPLLINIPSTWIKKVRRSSRS